MSIFNTSPGGLTFGDIYDISLDTPCDLYYAQYESFSSSSEPFLKQSIRRKNYNYSNELYMLCSVNLPDWVFYHGMKTREFCAEVLSVLKKCEIGGLDAMNDCLRTINLQNNYNIGLQIDIIRNYPQAIKSFHPITYQSTPGDKKIKIALDFPDTYLIRGSVNLPTTTRALLYIREVLSSSQSLPIKHFYCVTVPLLVKEGCIDVFSAR